MNSRNYAGIFGSLLIIAGGLSPMLHIPIIGNWNYFDIDVVLASIVFVLAALGLIGGAFGKNSLLKLSGWLSLTVIIFTLAAVYFKVNNYFSFIPLKKLAAAASSIIHYRWLGWGLMVLGSLTLIIFSRKKEIGIRKK
ncbi:hypothetical protein [Daejeonella oryzae]|uniref:hypothetical protein n=1 Tax=Daejeonella oryzae TaxID=1122943 RepID=UPI00042776B2|nr:hypothetical protein [Daejeonella oryzae]